MENDSSFLQTIDSEGRRMSRLVGDMLQLASADNHNWSIHPSKTELDTLLLQTWENFESLSFARGLRWDIPRPGHADYTAQVKYGGFQDVAGGGHFSGRLTAPLCIAGGICKQILARKGILVGAHIAAVGGIPDAGYDPVDLTGEALLAPGGKPFPVLDDGAGQAMQAAIAQAREEQDSLGGVVECAVLGLPAGLGDPMLDGMENRIAWLAFAIPAVKGVEFGAGFAAAALRGSQNNDPFYFDQAGRVRTRTNHAGGILGGITNGMPLLFRAAVKPTPSIGQPQESVSLSRRENTTLVIHGRHDPCIVPRAVPCVEAAAAIAVYDALLEQQKRSERT
ncbi:MAG TPA: chorismate synthase [Candidatus Evtepia faecavium]|nr:chorismate synthase [Candidatus Evtepia faecavium]